MKSTQELSSKWIPEDLLLEPKLKINQKKVYIKFSLHIYVYVNNIDADNSIDTIHVYIYTYYW